MKSLTRSRFVLIFCLAFVVVTSLVMLRPYASVVAARASSISPLLAALVQKFAPQAIQQPTRADQQTPPQKRQTQSRTGVEAGSNPEEQGKPDCPLPPHFDQLSSAAQMAVMNQLGCLPKGTTAPTQLEAQPTPYTSEAALANPQVNNPAADLTNRNTQSETTIVLGAGSNVIAAYNDSGSFISGASKFTGYAVSTDSGTTFTDQGTLPTNAGGDAGDPVLVRSAATGTIFLSTLEFNLDALQIFRSTDNGLTFNAPINGAPGFTAANANHDKEWIAVDNTPGPGFGNVYMTWRNFGSPGGITFTRSTDDGLTWGPNGGLLIEPVASGGSQGAFVTVGADHAVYVFWYDGTSPRKLRMRKSTDQGLTFGAAVTVTNLLTTGVNGALGLEFRSNAFIQAYAHPTDANILYAVYNDNPAGADRADVFFTQSNDGGATWTPGVRVNTDATTTDQYFPSLAIKPNGSTLAITWYDRRCDPTNTLIERWGRVGTIAGTTVTFGPDFVISDSSFPAIFGLDPVVNTTYMGDYDQSVADNTHFYTTWGDNRLGTQDVRFAKFTNAGPGMPILKILSTALSGGNGDSFINPNECNTLTVTVVNKGSVATAGDVSVTISTATPGAYTPAPTSTYPAIGPSGATATNTIPLKISTTAAYVCGTPVIVNITLTSAMGTETFTITLPGFTPNYTLTTMTGQAIEPGTALVAGSQADDASVAIALPFNYTFYDQTFTTLRASTNGNLQFTGNNTAFTNLCLAAGSLNNVIFPHWDDLLLTGAGEGIYTSTSGLAPNRIFNIEWRGRLFAGNAAVNFEVRLYEGQTKFDLIYGTVGNSGASATVGVQRDTGSKLTQFSCNTASLSSGLKITGTLQTGCPDGGGACIVAPMVSSISDPLFCTGDNNTVSVHAELPNPTNAPALFTFSAPLPPQLIGVPGTCAASAGTCTITATQVTVMGTLPANQTLTVDYKVRIPNGTPQGTNLCITSTGRLDVDGNGTLDTLDMVTACTVLNCPNSTIGVSAQKAGSVLVFPYYTSKAAEKKDTRITISNPGATVPTTYVHVFFIDGSNCNQSDQFVCLTPNASIAFKMSEYDPEVTGWLLAVAVDNQGRPTRNNVLIGNAFVNDGEYVDNYGAESFQAKSPALAALNDTTATLFFDGSSYDAVPNQFMFEIQSPLDAAGQKIVTAGLNGNLTTGQLSGAGQVGTGLVINGNETPLGSFVSFLSGACQAQALISGSNPRVPGGMSKLIPIGQVGTVQLNVGGAVGLLMTPRTAKWSGIRALHKTRLTGATLIIPVLQPVC